MPRARHAANGHDLLLLSTLYSTVPPYVLAGHVPGKSRVVSANVAREKGRRGPVGV